MSISRRHDHLGNGEKTQRGRADLVQGIVLVTFPAPRPGSPVQSDAAAQSGSYDRVTCQCREVAWWLARVRRR